MKQFRIIAGAALILGCALLVGGGRANAAEDSDATVSDSTASSYIYNPNPMTNIMYNITPQEYLANIFAGVPSPNNGVAPAMVGMSDTLWAALSYPVEGTLLMCSWQGISQNSEDGAKWTVFYDLPAVATVANSPTIGTPVFGTSFDLSDYDLSAYSGVALSCYIYPADTTEKTYTDATNAGVSPTIATSATWLLDNPAINNTNNIQPSTPTANQTTGDDSAQTSEDVVATSTAEQPAAKADATVKEPAAGFAIISHNPLIILAAGALAIGAIMILSRRKNREN